ncbi:uncharacterized protein LOC123197523 isoform X1 [Mangifera indica]|uniref:uncharacterized protein LOC123197523 isoform X1 n=1 Tax=Mangifera indica TaxID=29780 RepID=UPI001CFA646D|nr:uncharacterized protein LOC123197523 isoform X1 [Mangifera indica]
METNVKSESSTSSEDPNPCPICLGPIVQDSYLDKCYHKFCYDCIVQWTKVVARKHSSLVSSVKCPLCKMQTESFSIIYGYDGTHFLRHYISQNSGDRFLFSKAHKYRLQCYYTESGILNDIFNVSRYWKSHKYLQSNQWLQGWLRREVQALMQEEDVEIIVHHIVGVVGSFLRRNEQMRRVEKPEAKQEEFKALVSDAARPFLMARTDRFVNEMELFLASGLNIEAFDAVYMQRLGWNSPRVTIESPERGSSGQTSVIVPYLHIFDEDSDGTD